MAKGDLTTGNPPNKIMVIGGSAGSLAMALKVMQRLCSDMDVCLILVFHRKTNEENVLVNVLSSRTKLEVREVEDKDQVTSGTVFIAPADYHVLIEKNGAITLDDSEKVHFSRPSIDVTFESASEVFKDRLVCVLLSGANADGAAGLVHAKKFGSTVVVQDPSCAEVPFMPQQAIDLMKPDLLLSEENVDQLMSLLV